MHEESSQHIVVTQRIPAPAEERLRGTGRRVVVLGADGPPPRDALIDNLRGASALVCLLSEPIGADLMDAAGPSLKVIANYAVGFDNIDVAAATERGIAVANTPDVLTDATAELAIALMFAAARHVVPGDAMVRAGEFRGWQPALMRGVLLTGKTFGLVGAGRIGRATARRAVALGMRVVYSSRTARSEFEADCPARRLTLDELLEKADVVSLHVSLAPETRHLIDEARLRRMRPGAILVNTARGPVVDERALVRALREGRIAAGLDVYEHEPALTDGLAAADNAVLLPHLGSATTETRAAMAELTARAVTDVLAGRCPPNLVNPAVWMER